MAKLTFNERLDSKLSTLRVEGSNTYDAGLAIASANSIGTRGATLDVDIHATAVAAIHVSIAHGDTGPAVRLCNKLPKGTRVKSLVQWFTAFSNILLRYDSKASAYVAKMNKEGSETYLASPDTAKAQATPFWTPAEKVDPAAFDDCALALAVANLIKRARKDNAELSAVGAAALADLGKISGKLPGNLVAAL